MSAVGFGALILKLQSDCFGCRRYRAERVPLTPAAWIIKSFFFFLIAMKGENNFYNDCECIGVNLPLVTLRRDWYWRVGASTSLRRDWYWHLLIC